MATAISNIEKKIPNQTEEQTQAAQQILQAAAHHHVPLIKFLDILAELDQLGVLDALDGMLKNSKQIALIGLGQMNKPGAHRMIRNGMGAVQFLSALDPVKLQTIMNGVTSGVEHAADNQPNGKQEGLWSLVKRMRDPEVMSSISMLTRFLQGMGKGLSKTTH